MPSNPSIGHVRTMLARATRSQHPMVRLLSANLSRPVRLPDGRFANPPEWHSFHKHRNHDIAKLLRQVRSDQRKITPVSGRIVPLDHERISSPKSPLQLFGPARYTDAPCRVEDLPPIDAVLLSHSHYDHLDENTVHRLLLKEETDRKRQAVVSGAADDGTPTSRRYFRTRWFAPLGCGEQLHRFFNVPRENIRSLSWWECAAADQRQLQDDDPSSDKRARFEAETDAHRARWVEACEEDENEALRVQKAHPSFKPSAGPTGFAKRIRESGVRLLQPLASALRPGTEVDCMLPGADTELQPWARTGVVSSMAASAAACEASGEVPLVHAVPAQHNTARTLFDRDMSLWGGFVVRGRSRRYYFSGDTGYQPPRRGEDARGLLPVEAEALRAREADSGGVGQGAGGGSEEPSAAAVAEEQHLREPSDEPCPAFREIGDVHGPIDVGSLPIGAYHPRWFMASVHASPEDAVSMMKDTRCRRAVGHHWGTFPLTTEPTDEPPMRVASKLRLEGMPEDCFVACDHGETLSVDADEERAGEAWWVREAGQDWARRGGEQPASGGVAEGRQ